MAVDKLVDSTQLDSDLTSVANAIRTKGGTSASLAFPAGFVEAIGAISAGAEVIKGTFTVPDSGSNYVINIGKTLSKYLYIIEMTEASKTALMLTGYNANKAYARVGIYPIPQCGNTSLANSQHFSLRVNPSTGAGTATAATVNGIDGSSITIPIVDVSGSANAVYKGYSYDYTFISLE